MSISKVMWANAATAALGLVVVFGLSGCGEPANIVPAAPPGTDYHDALPQPKEDPDTGPQALGEAGAASASSKIPPLADLVPAPPTAAGETKTTPAGVKYETLREGTGDTAKAGQNITIRYVGRLEDGRTFDSSDSAPFLIGCGKLIPGWDQGVPGMKVGEKRKLTIPPSAGYGAQGSPPKVPPNATLIFEVELLKTQDQ